jgi:hypothetical protein
MLFLLSFLSKILFEARLLLKKEKRRRKKEREGQVSKRKRKRYIYMQPKSSLSFKVQNERSYPQVKEHSKIRFSPILSTTYIFSTIS